MIKPEALNWREARRRSASDAIREAAWQLVRREGLAGLSLRDLARSAGITPPTVYAYFGSKNAIYDAMFAQAAAEFEARMSEPYGRLGPRRLMEESIRRFFDFCRSDPTRYQLLFQRTVPGFEPSPEAYAPAVRALAGAREMLAANGVTKPQHIDLWTALVTGLIDQQISNDPGGERWTGLVDESVAMFLAHCSPPPSATTRRPRPGSTKGADNDHDDDRRHEHRAPGARRSDAAAGRGAGANAGAAPPARRRRVGRPN